MMWRAFVPVRDRHDTDELPAWFVSFDGERFIEVRRKPELSQVSMLKTLWGATLDGPSRRASRNGLLQVAPVLRKDLERIAELEQLEETDGTPQPQEV